MRFNEQLEVEVFRVLHRNYIDRLRDGRGLFVNDIDLVPRCNVALALEAWDDATQIKLSIEHALGDLLERVVLPETGTAGQVGLRQFVGLAPLVGPEAELDVRGFVREFVLDSPR
ncbi:hypothetical protein A9995_05950 [Erythrobacter sp. QSSC1-22B]|nr:hypothetical protein A9995_05950 [Erythrobacter sp. QSSC1-22B]